MANEAVLRDTKVLTSRRYACASGVAIPKGTYLYNVDAATASTAITAGAHFIGFAHADVNNSTDSSFNTETSVTADKGGMYELLASLAITNNAYVVTAGRNCVMQASQADMTASIAYIVGIARETASAGETINVEVFP